MPDEHYHVFLSHSSRDKPFVRLVAKCLHRDGILFFLDEAHLVPGEPWQLEIERALSASDSCAVFIGDERPERYHALELRVALSEQAEANRSFRVIPVLLPGHTRPMERDLPAFLRQLTWVEFTTDPDQDATAYRRLKAGIEGKEPGFVADGRNERVSGAAPTIDSRPPFAMSSIRVILDAPGDKATVEWGEKTVEIITSGPEGIDVAEVKSGELLQLASGEYRLRVVDDEYKTERPLVLFEGRQPDLHIRLLDVHDFNVEKNHDHVTCVAYSPKGKQFAAGRGDFIELWDVDSRQLQMRLNSNFVPPGSPPSVYHIAYSPDGTKLASTHYDYAIRLWDTQTGQLIRELKTSDSQQGNVAYSPDGKHLASGNDFSGFVHIWDTDSGHEVLTLDPSDEYVFLVAYSPNGEYLFLAPSRQRVVVYDVRTGKKSFAVDVGESPTCLAISPDGLQLAVGTFEGRVRVWDLQMRLEIQSTRGSAHRGRVECVAFRRDGKVLASAGSDRTVKVWQLDVDQELLTIDGNVERRRKQTEEFTSVAFSPDDRSLLTASKSKSVGLRLWTFAQG